MSPPLAISDIGDLNQMNSGVYCVPVWLGDDGLEIDRSRLQGCPNLSGAAQSYLERLGASVEDLFHHILAVLHDPTYNQVNADALRAEGPRIPLSGWPDGGEEAAETLASSAARGRELARLLDPEAPVPGVTQGALRPDIATIAVPATTDGRNMTGDDFALTAGWGHYGTGDAVMPGQGQIVERAYTPDEKAAMGDNIPTLGETTFDVYLNGRTFWRNVPAAVWRYKLGGYQVLKKWLSYRERDILDRSAQAQKKSSTSPTPQATNCKHFDVVALECLNGATWQVSSNLPSSTQASRKPNDPIVLEETSITHIRRLLFANTLSSSCGPSSAASDRAFYRF